MSKEMKMADYFDLPVSDGFVEMLDHSQCNRFVSDGVAEFDAIAHAINSHDRLVDEVEVLREALRLKEAECEALASDVSRIVSAAADAHLSGSEQLHVDHLYRVIHDASGKLYNDEMGRGR